MTVRDIYTHTSDDETIEIMIMNGNDCSIMSSNIFKSTDIPLEYMDFSVTLIRNYTNRLFVGCIKW